MNVADLVRGAKSEQRQLIDAYVGAKRFGQSLPRLEGAALARYMPPELTEAQRNEIRKAVADEFEFDRKTVVYPEWIKFRCETLNKSISSVTDAVGKADAVDGFGEVRAQFEKAREQLWAEIDTAVLDGVPVPEVNEPVRAYAMNLLVGKVNVAHWAIIEREMIKIADDSIAAAKPEEGVKSLEAYPWVRAYPGSLTTGCRPSPRNSGGRGFPSRPPRRSAWRLTTTCARPPGSPTVSTRAGMTGGF